MSLKKFLLDRQLSLPLWYVLIFLAISTLTRLALIVLHWGEISTALFYIPLSLLTGLVMDLYISLWVTLPLALLLWLFPLRWRESRWIQYPCAIAGWLFTFGLLYLGVTELFFFQEFDSRLNYIAVDYLIYPHEVFVNLWDTYPVLTVMIVTAVIAGAFTWYTRSIRRRSLAWPKTRKAQAGTIFGYVVLLTFGIFLLNIDFSRVCNNRTMNEIGGNGIYSFFYAGFTNVLDYNQYYATGDRNQAMQRVKSLLADDHTTFINANPTNPIARFVESDSLRRSFNIVLVIEESFGSNFIGSLHPDGKNLTPRFDSVAAEHGMLFTNIYATGNRTVRGIEATLASFPPIPGRSIVKRPGCEHVFTMSSVLKELGYNTLFMYGGMSYFDNIGPFARSNGYDKVIDELDFKDYIFRTIWGVCDEDLFNKSLQELDSLDNLGAPFFATLLTVSNHTPFTYPEGRIPYDPNVQTREYAVRYADYSIGKFIRDAKSHPFFDSTLFVFVADHGARIYGSEQIPILSYEIPLLFYNPTLYPTGQRCDVLGSQMDISPTILDVLGIDYNSEFFGRSISSTTPQEARALMSHDRDVSLMRDSTIAILGIQGNKELWTVDKSSGKFFPYSSPDSSLVFDAISYYMTAYDMFQDGQLAPLPQSGKALAQNKINTEGTQ